ncbi:hypothetical protein ABMA28_009490 [Loxostege sticticalis]|uniref:Uncharacterized protein n=1 Tax=Loxostege sticticalis TaxID=481309 RepID=A0ABD0SDH4_LOXSC
MCDLKICRICLRTEAKMYKFDRFQLLYYYEEVMALKVNENDGLPHYFCYECATMLHKFHKFKEKCYTGQKALKEILWKGAISYELVYKVDRNFLNLQSPLNILKVEVLSSNVKTYTTVDDEELNLDIKEEDVDISYNNALSDCDDNQEIFNDEANQNDEKPLLLPGEKHLDKIDEKPSLLEADSVMKTVKHSRKKSPHSSVMFANDSNQGNEKPLLLLDDNDTDTVLHSKENPLHPATVFVDETHHSNENPILLDDTDIQTSINNKKKPLRPTTVFIDETNEDNEKPILLLEDSDSEIVVPKKKKTLCPTTVFVDDNKKIIIMENEPVKENKRRTIAISRNPKKFNFVTRKKKTTFLDASHWKKINLSEEEAVSNFRAKSEDSKYVGAPFKCTDCFKGFSKDEMLKRHKHLRHNVAIGEHECRFCKMRFKWDCHLRKHMCQHFVKYQCLRCDLVCYIETSALLHDEYHNGIIRKCIHCDEEFRHMSTYYTHMRTHRSEYICALCGASFVSAAGLRQHKRRKHIDTEIESPDDDEEVNTFCEKCDIRFETRKAYNEHLFHSAMHMEGVDYALVDEYSLPKKVLGKRAKKQITLQLIEQKNKDGEKLPPTTSHRKKKKQRRVSRKPMNCHQCGKHFETQAACMKHHQAEHPKTSFFAPTERHICEICGASLAPGSVAMHQNIHSREKVFPCGTCSRSFHSSIGLKRHAVTHTGEKPFGCTLCDKKFTQSNSMKLHYRTFHLKQPYPKRNRRKKKDELPMVTDESKTGEESSSSVPEQERQMMPQEHHDVHYLTLN